MIFIIIFNDKSVERRNPGEHCETSEPYVSRPVTETHGLAEQLRCINSERSSDEATGGEGRVNAVKQRPVF